jgi:hypothetical protein
VRPLIQLQGRDGGHMIDKRKYTIGSSLSQDTHTYLNAGTLLGRNKAATDTTLLFPSLSSLITLGAVCLACFERAVTNERSCYPCKHRHQLKASWQLLQRVPRPHRKQGQQQGKRLTWERKTGALTLEQRCQDKGKKMAQ